MGNLNEEYKPKIPTTEVKTVTTALSEISFNLTNVKQLTVHSRTNTVFRSSYVSGKTTSSQSFITTLSGNEYHEKDINYTGVLYVSVESLPTEVTVNSCSTTNGSPTVTSGNSFASATIGQLVTGTGIPADTYIIARTSADTSITLGDANGTPVNATATGTVTLTFSGAVIRCTTWS